VAACALDASKPSANIDADIDAEINADVDADINAEIDADIDAEIDADILSGNGVCIGIRRDMGHASEAAILAETARRHESIFFDPRCVGREYHAPSAI
jgi:hypothetical protein